MGKEYFELLAKYNKESNRKMNDIIKTLSTEEWDKEFPGFYKSIHGLCSHLFMSDYSKLKSLKLIDNFQSLNDDYFNKTYSSKDVLFSNMNEYLIKRPELDDIIIHFINEINDNSLLKTTTFKNHTGITFEKRMDIILLHIFNHGTHHRGMISLYLEMSGKENDYSGLYFYG
ncbi:MAG: DinB family protein [Spirochaetaceae bacterium]|jgi:uncharacterized damage-inducible protein DinB|nr:DinB family protein [Spirochaetaceae bacterium]